MCVEIHNSARRHGIPDEDIEHAFEHIVAWNELDDEVPRFLVAGPNRAGNILELVFLDLERGVGDSHHVHAKDHRIRTFWRLRQ
ncbi:MAG: hypothetical protein M1134_03920 [Actinobacteria bacterium]|nr:hypothetical protein [Actinomycetota bacterium]